VTESLAAPRRIEADPEKVEQGLAQLVLTLIELLRQLMSDRRSGASSRGRSTTSRWSVSA